MNDRGMVKWAPFNSVINGSSVLREIEIEKNKIEKPILSEEQIEMIETKIIESYQSNSNIEIVYYKNNQINTIIGKITKLDPINKKIIINKYTNIYFGNILDIFNKNT